MTLSITLNATFAKKKEKKSLVFTSLHYKQIIIVIIITKNNHKALHSSTPHSPVYFHYVSLFVLFCCLWRHTGPHTQQCCDHITTMIHAHALDLLQDILCAINLLSEFVYWITNSRATSHPIQHLANYHHHPAVPQPIELPSPLH